MDQDKRILLAFALSMVLLLGYRMYLTKFAPPPAKSRPAQNQLATNQAPSAATPAGAEGSTASQAPAGKQQDASKTSAALPVQKGSGVSDVVVENDLYRITFSNQGAVVKSWILKKYKNEFNQPLNLVNTAAGDKLGFPLSFTTSDSALTSALNSAVYVATPASGQVQAPGKLEFVYSDGKIEARKTFSFGAGYEVGGTVSVSDGARFLPVGIAWRGGFGDPSLLQQNPKLAQSSTVVLWGTADNVDTLAQQKVKEGNPQQVASGSELNGIEDRYFVDILLPDAPETTSFSALREVWREPPGWWKEKELPKPLTVSLESAQAAPLKFRLVVAPKDLDVLRAQRPPLDKLVKFGWFTVVAKPMFLALRFIYEHLVHNWGWAIVILTMLISIVTFPLKLKSIRSAQEMQRVQPLVKSIQDKYKQYKFNDPRKQKMNEEMMKLYKEHGINPLGGCLPMLLQLPFLYGFYRVLDLSIELRHAPWIGCVQDLSLPDHCHLLGIPVPILPTVMIITMFILQRMTPVATADPAQQRMMMIMPLFFGIMFYNFASGLVLYWLTSNVIGIAQQWILNRTLPPPVKPIPPPAARKRSGPGQPSPKPVGVK
jgi:YidC/Oxa1 family membrane protein insertase